MLWRLLADSVVILHGAFVVFVALGGLLVLWRRVFLWLHPPAALWGFSIEVLGWVCPLTYLENALRRAGGEAGYADSFVERYLMPLIYPVDLTRELQLALAAAVVTINVAVYAAVLARLRRRG